MDGVIFDSERLIIECWKIVAKKYGIEDIEKTCRACIGINRQATEQTFYRRYGEKFDYDKYRREAAEIFHASLKDGVLPVKKGVRELLSFIENKKIPAAIASSTQTEIVVKELEDAGLRKFFTKIIGGDMVKNSKPAPDIFLLAAKELETEPKDCIVAEDSYNGVKAAVNAGMRCIMIPDLLPPTEEMYALAYKVLPDISAVEEFIKKL